MSLARAALLYARYLCLRDALGIKAAGMPSAARDDRVSCIQAALPKVALRGIISQVGLKTSKFILRD